MENVISKEVAEQEFNRMGELNYLDFDLDGEKPETVDAFNDAKRVIVKSIMRGNLVIDDSGVPIYTPANSPDNSPITFHKPQGKDYAETDRKKKEELMGKTYAALGAWTKQPPVRFINLAINPDLKVCQALFSLFF